MPIGLWEKVQIVSFVKTHKALSKGVEEKKSFQGKDSGLRSRTTEEKRAKTRIKKGRCA